MTQDKLDQYKKELIKRLNEAGNAFYEVEGFLRNSLNKNREIKRELLTKALDSMPVFGEAIAVLDSIPPKELGTLAQRNIVHDSVVGTKDESFGYGRKPYRVHDSLKT